MGGRVDVHWITILVPDTTAVAQVTGGNPDVWQRTYTQNKGQDLHMRSFDDPLVTTKIPKKVSLAPSSLRTVIMATRAMSNSRM